MELKNFKEILDSVFPSAVQINRKSATGYDTNDIMQKQIFVYGKQGSGKTELMRGIAEYLAEKYGAENINVRIAKGDLEILINKGLENKLVNFLICDDATLEKIPRQTLIDFFRIRHLLKERTKRNNGLVITAIISHRFHGCYEGECVVITPNGEVKISNVKKGDKILGYEHGKEIFVTVENIIKEKSEYPTMLIKTDTSYLRVVNDNAFVQNKGYVETEELKVGDIFVKTWKKSTNLDTKRRCINKNILQNFNIRRNKTKNSFKNDICDKAQSTKTRGKWRKTLLSFWKKNRSETTIQFKGCRNSTNSWYNRWGRNNNNNIKTRKTCSVYTSSTNTSNEYQQGTFDNVKEKTWRSLTIKSQTYSASRMEPKLCLVYTWIRIKTFINSIKTIFNSKEKTSGIPATIYRIKNRFGSWFSIHVRGNRIIQKIKNITSEKRKGKTKIKVSIQHISGLPEEEIRSIEWEDSKIVEMVSLSTSSSNFFLNGILVHNVKIPELKTDMDLFLIKNSASNPYDHDVLKRFVGEELLNDLKTYEAERDFKPELKGMTIAYHLNEKYMTNFPLAKNNYLKDIDEIIEEKKQEIKIKPRSEFDEYLIADIKRNNPNLFLNRR